MEKIEQAQKYLREEKVDGWLLYDFAGNNPLLYQFLNLSPQHPFRRRFFYWIPSQGEPVKIVHAIESHVLDKWPGEKKRYASWKTLHEALSALLKGKKRVAMEYSPNNDIPYMSKIDGGTLDLIRSMGPEVVSSAPFLPQFTAVLSPSQAESQRRAGKVVEELVDLAWDWIGEKLQRNEPITEWDVQQKIGADFARKKMVSDSFPNVSVNAHSADPHYLPTKESALPIHRGDFLLIDMWCREEGEGSVFADITRVAIAAKEPSEEQKKVFQIVRNAQKKATDFVKEKFEKNQLVRGYEVDDIARQVIEEAGYGPQFIHRTGHNIGIELHGSGAHIDNFEMHDIRPILKGTSFSIEPGIYLEGSFGIRQEYDLYITPEGKVEIVGGFQDEIVLIQPKSNRNRH